MSPLPLRDAPSEDSTASAPKARLERVVEAHYALIQALPLFKNLPPYIVYEILHNAHLFTHKKGAMILTQGEALEHFYVVLDGWVKIFKNSPDGREATLQILGARSFLFENGLTGACACPTNVQVIEPVKLLAIPLTVMRDHVAQSSGLAENLLHLFMLRNQDVMAHLENLTLRTAKERVGFFMLKIWMDTKPDELSFTLPFDKALIAAHLDIRAETLSRILKELQTEGLSIHGPQITLENSKTLCPFCDPATALRCHHATAPCLEIAPKCRL